MLNATEDNKNYLTAFLKSFDFDKFKKAVLEVNRKFENNEDDCTAELAKIEMDDGAKVVASIDIDYDENYDGGKTFSYSLYLFHANNSQYAMVDGVGKFNPFYADDVMLTDMINSVLYNAAYNLIKAVELRLREVNDYLNSLSKLNEAELSFIKEGWNKIPLVHRSATRLLGNNLHSFLSISNNPRVGGIQVELKVTHLKKFELSRLNPNKSYGDGLIELSNALRQSQTEIRNELRRIGIAD